VPRDDVIVGANQDRVGPAPFLHRCRNPRYLFAAVRARIVGPRNQAFDRPTLDLDVNFTEFSRTRRLDGKPDYRNDRIAV
jgi:hypothetical protein